jgi:hypothetical protein
VARRCSHPKSVVDQMPDDPATEKTGSAENRDEPAMANGAVCYVFCQGRKPTCPPVGLGRTFPVGSARRYLSKLQRPSLSTSKWRTLWMSRAKLTITPPAPAALSRSARDPCRK